MWQTAVGAWPIDAQRLTGYLVKAAREAKAATSWTSPDETFEAARRGLRHARRWRTLRWSPGSKGSWPCSSRHSSPTAWGSARSSWRCRECRTSTKGARP